MTSGAMVSVSPKAGSTILRSHTTSPVALLMRSTAAGWLSERGEGRGSRASTRRTCTVDDFSFHSP